MDHEDKKEDGTTRRDFMVLAASSVAAVGAAGLRAQTAIG